MNEDFAGADILSAIAQETQQRFTQVGDLAHGWEHVERVYKLAQYIAQREEADRFIVGAAALMHDLGRTATAETGADKTTGDAEHQHQHHADISVELARDILQHYHVNAEQQQAIFHAIIAHSFSKGITPRTKEAGIVRDADRLDALGAIGILRWAMVSEQKRRSGTRSYHPTDPLAEQHTPDDRAYILDHFPAKLLTLAEQMTTETGKQLAQQRTAYMRDFLHHFQAELTLLA